MHLLDFMCGSGWMYVNTFPGKCLKLFTSPHEFEDARKKCWDNGGQLMTMLETINQLIFGMLTMTFKRMGTLKLDVSI